MKAAVHMQLWVQDHRPALLALLMVVLVMGLATSCPSEGGWSQEGDDVTWRT